MSQLKNKETKIVSLEKQEDENCILAYNIITTTTMMMTTTTTIIIINSNIHKMHKHMRTHTITTQVHTQVYK